MGIQYEYVLQGNGGSPPDEGSDETNGTEKRRLRYYWITVVLALLGIAIIILLGLTNTARWGVKVPFSGRVTSDAILLFVHSDQSLLEEKTPIAFNYISVTAPERTDLGALSPILKERPILQNIKAEEARMIHFQCVNKGEFSAVVEADSMFVSITQTPKAEPKQGATTLQAGISMESGEWASVMGMAADSSYTFAIQHTDSLFFVTQARQIAPEINRNIVSGEFTVPGESPVKLVRASLHLNGQETPTKMVIKLVNKQLEATFTCPADFAIVTEGAEPHTICPNMLRYAFTDELAGITWKVIVAYLGAMMGVTGFIFFRNKQSSK